MVLGTSRYSVDQVPWTDESISVIEWRLENSEETRSPVRRSVMTSDINTGSRWRFRKTTSASILSTVEERLLFRIPVLNWKKKCAWYLRKEWKRFFRCDPSEISDNCKNMWHTWPKSNWFDRCLNLVMQITVIKKRQAV